MIRYTTGDIFESNAKCIVNTVNCEGYMGKGIAYQFKLRFPENNKDYIRACKNGELRIGTIHSFFENGILIINFPTKNKWREKSQLSYIKTGLDKLRELINEKKISSIAIPPLGCGNGGLKWHDVKEIINHKLAEVQNDCDVIVYEPFTSCDITSKTVPRINVSGLVLLQIKMQLSNFDSLRLQKTGYFVNYFLKEEYFKFDKWHHGPYSYSIDVVARNIKQYQQCYNLTNSEDTYQQIYNVICSKRTVDKLKKLLPAIKQATTYVNNVSTNKKLEGISTVLYIIQKNYDGYTVDEIIKKFSRLEDKEKGFSSDYIFECIQYLVDTNFIMKNGFGRYVVSAKSSIARSIKVNPRDPERIACILGELEKTWRSHPDLRLGQLIMDIIPDENARFNIEDDKMLDAIKSFGQ